MKKERFANLPAKEIICPVPEEERICDWYNAEMIPMKPTFVREELRITPAAVERVYYMQEALICPECKKDKDGSFKKGEVPGAFIPHSPAFAQLGAKIPRETLANGCIIAAEKYLFPIYDLIHSVFCKYFLDKVYYLK